MSDLNSIFSILLFDILTFSILNLHFFYSNLNFLGYKRLFNWSTLLLDKFNSDNKQHLLNPINDIILLKEKSKFFNWNSPSNF